MERRKKRVKDNVGSYKECCECESACTKGYKAYFVVQILLKFLKESSEKIKNGGISQADQRENRRFFGL